MQIARAEVPVGRDGALKGNPGSELRGQLNSVTPALVGVFAVESNGLSDALADLQEAFPQSTVVGTTTAGQFSDRGEQEHTVVAWAIAGRVRAHAHLANGLRADPASAVARVAAGASAPDADMPHQTALVLLDGMAGNGEEVTLLLSGHLGPSVRLVGGAAADNFAMQRTLVGTGDRLAEDALAVVYIDSATPLGIGVAHGHRPLSAPMTVTEASGNLVHTIDGRAAWDVWIENTSERARELGLEPERLSSPEAVFDFLNRFEAGLSVGETYKLRVPLAREGDGALRFGCGVPEGTVLRVMESDHAAQIDSAAAAARQATSRIGGWAQTAGALVFDCSCRKTILGDAFDQAVGAVSETLGHRPMAGFETYGEIAMDPDALSGFHNTTTVVLALPNS